MAALRDQRDEDIDLSDIPELTDASRAVIGKFYRPIKETGGDVTQLCDS